MHNQITPIRPLEAAGTSWIVAGLVGVFAFGALMVNGAWTFLQAAFAGAVVLVVLGTLISLTIGRIKPLGSHLRNPATRPVMAEGQAALGVDLTALRPRDLNAPSPHRTEPTASVISDGIFKQGVRPDLTQPIRGEVETAPATRIPAPAPINAADVGVARPVGATANPAPMAQPAPLNGRIVSPEPPQPMDASRTGGTVSRNDAALAAGAGVVVRPTGTPAAQSYNEPGRGSDTVEASGGTLADAAPFTAGADSQDAGDAGASDPSSAAERTAMGEAEAQDAAPADPALDDRPKSKPPTMDGPREGGADDLMKIKGIGPKMAEMLHGMGFYHFEQIAAWTEEEVAWVDSNLEGFHGRVSRDEWVPQARALVAGGDTD